MRARLKARASWEVWVLEDAAANADVNEYIQTVARDDPPSEKAIEALLLFGARIGHINNEEKFRRISGSGNLYEFKPKGHRVTCFQWDGKKWICTHAFKKPKKGQQQREFERAEQIRDEFLELVKRGKIEFIEGEDNANR